VKKSIAVVSLIVALTALTLPAFADSPNDGQAQVKNLRTGSRNTAAGWVEVLDATHEEAAKGKSTGEQLTGVVAGGAIGVRRTIHRVGAGAIDLLTFWIPKKQPLVNPEKARLE
jgi:putative exosortase-associated protein (TIGR04073 family)